MIADEPTTALDVTVQRQVLQLVERLRQRHGAAVLFVTHDLGVVAKICRSMTVLHAGRVLEEGETADVLARPRHRLYARAAGGDAARRPAGRRAAAGAAGPDRAVCGRRRIGSIGRAAARPA